ncbi:MAG: hypothetical protein R2875_07085 [Desulfobacterales bacterium]
MLISGLGGSWNPASPQFRHLRKNSVSMGIGTGEQDRVGVAEIAQDKGYRKLADRYCFEEHGVSYNDLTDADKGGHRRPGGGRKRRTGRRHHGE